MQIPIFESLNRKSSLGLLRQKQNSLHDRIQKMLDHKGSLINESDREELKDLRSRWAKAQAEIDKIIA